MAFFTGGAKDVMRAMTLMKRRQQEHEHIEAKKKKIEVENRMTTIDDKFKAHCDTVDSVLKSETVGLVSLEDMKKKQEILSQSADHCLGANKKIDTITNKKLPQISKLSFAADWLAEEEEQCTNESDVKAKKKKRLGKNPNVDTSFLPDKDREEEEMKLREELRQEWIERQNQLKSEEIEIVFSFWDGSGHPRSVKLRKGNSVQQFLHKTMELLRRENSFSELKSASVDQLMYVKDDVILPHHHTFYDFIVTRARGKHGALLFSFDPNDEMSQRVTNDAVVDKDETHAGKVVLRSWYERNKHIFPACRWEPFDPERRNEGSSLLKR